MIAEARYKVLVSHAPPRNTEIDKSFARLHVGSGPVRDFLLAGSVNLCICGHIHEARGEDILGKAQCVNVGPFKNGRYALIAIDGARASVQWRMR
jgi:Icc-related predicted phosphoesterase